ncbi:hypothetical protein A3D84_05875 [Candidatus Woesebacteria bacterium RIFCSPHIGHO2_02_FULL_42_20]|uniref:Uncharacterized protein n=1 Tax=Candidatus Woesebacteria bacterium RIFCSPHIGHO2_12_FULL_41_24 TaxID=1802510 RepID=A0A1F8AUI0_9BACT|nr:MAG: hypothetical protein A2W15_01445 [Candidatus Woesebacteria bacterium RBG_16_41_13]OGM29878.1 MAG: hypothetical protein A2873_04225 [Candidatus Woesebacteria bacterium RIFCSPHIGHO2_01_FULL_42_80]OGM35315.1 MAG: hypothetical protein A3D84_05875 [Candidatus Woesebacteria bacterium RIFCSPHIGHO2_02_FULL_42_20]OGM54928.1 MAG: hypothetical protein A3E44_03870 [Candidatus Woesebacteria bacterium RIFCSPHIGHO2_12_FULL_41_24]OGM67559.1 MAG: hypothetical protein A2969_01275 [Candidatus Woesebacteri
MNINKSFTHFLILVVLILIIIGGIGYYTNKNGGIKSTTPQKQVRFTDTKTCTSMETPGYNYVFSGPSYNLNGETKIDLDNDGQEEIVRVYKQESSSGERSKPIIVKIFSATEDCPKEVFSHYGQPTEYPNEFVENPQVFQNFWGDGSNVVSVEAISTAYGSGSSMQLLLFTYRGGNYSVIEGPQVQGHNWQCCMFYGDNGIGQKIIAAENRWADDYSDYCAGCDSRFQFFIYTWNSKEYIKTEAGVTEKKYSGDIEEIVQKEPSVVNPR